MDPHAIWQQFKYFYEAVMPISEKSQQAFAVYSDIPHPFFNAVMHISSDHPATTVDDLIQRAPSANPISFWVHPQNRAEGLAQSLQTRGFAPLITCPLMAWTVRPVSSSEYDIRPAKMEIFHDIIADVYQMDEATKREFQKLMGKLACENYLVYQDGLPVGTGTLLVNGSAGGIFNDATLPNRREASLALMQFLMRRASELNLKQLIVLSSPEGEELYKDLGFEKAFDIEIYSKATN